MDSGYWPLFRYDPRRVAAGENPLQLDCPAPKIDLAKFMGNETRFRTVKHVNPARYKKLMDQAQHDIREKYSLYEHLSAAMKPVAAPGNGVPKKP